MAGASTPARPLPFRVRALRVVVLSRILAVVVLAGAVLADRSFDLRLAALVVLVTANLAYLITRVPWGDLLERPGGRRWLYTWSVVDVSLVTLGIGLTGEADSELFVLYALAMVLFAATYPRRGQAALLAFTCVSYLAVVAAGGWETTLAGTVVRLGALALVTYVASFLAGELLGETVGHRQARAESESRAASLATVAAAARTMSTLDPAEVLEMVVDAASQLGFDGAELCLFDAAADTWRVAHLRGVDPEPAPVRPIDAGAAGLVHARRDTVVLDEHSGWPLTARDALDAGYRFLVACPVWSAGDLVGALVAGGVERTSPSPHEVECLELLAAHAGAALHNASLYAERQAFEERLAHQAFHDALTGLPNRALFLDRLDQALARARRDGEALGVLFMDLDRFKEVNDSLGHEGGDELLAAVSLRLQGCLRPGDTLARYGGDEFTVLVEKLRTDADGIDVADRLLRALDDPFTLRGHQVSVTGSIGVAFAKAPFTDIADPLREADHAMYRAKERGAGCWEVFRSGLDVRGLRRLELEAELRTALDRCELRVQYQPIVDLASGRVTGVEALTRWRHSERGDIEPSEFLAAAERAALGLRLGAWVLEEACHQVVAWERAGLPSVDLSVNVTAQQLAAPEFAGAVGEALGGSGLAPERLLLETGEMALLGPEAPAAGGAAALGALGVHLCIDNLGHGHAALRELKRFPVRAVKIDVSLVHGLPSDAGDRAVFRSLVALANGLGIEVGALGVETAEQLKHLRSGGCRTAQGFLFAPPVRPDIMAALLKVPEVPAAVRSPNPE